MGESSPAMTGPTKLSRNAKCPCGSGRKYKACCFNKGFHYLVEEDGSITRSVPLGDEMVSLLKEQEVKFIAKHGRPPRPEDPIFDPEETPDDDTYEKEMSGAMEKAGIDPALIYAFKKTGVLLTEMNQHLVPTKDAEAFQAAVDEYREQHGGDQDPDG